MKGKIKLLCVAVLLLVAGCEDPSAEDIAKAEKLDIETIHGKVIALGISEYKGDATHTAGLKGQTYYWADIQYTESGKVVKVEQYRGLLPEVVESLSVGIELPVMKVVSASDLTRITGVIVDLYRDPVQGIYMILVCNHLEHKVFTYRVDRYSYYTLFRVGQELPLDPKQETRAE